MSNWRSVLGLTIGLLVGAGVTVGNAAEIPNWAREQLALRKTVDHWIRADIQAYHDQGFKAMFPDIRGHGADEIGGWTRSWLGAYCLSGNEDIPRTMKALRDTWREGVTNSGHYRRGYPANKESDTVKHTAEGFSQGMLNMLYLDLKDPKSVSFVEEAAGLMGNWVPGVQPFYNWQEHHFRGYFLGTKAPEVGQPYDYESWVHFRVLAIVLGAYEATRNPRYLELCEDYCGFWAREILAAPSDGEVPSNVLHATEEQWRQWQQQGPEARKPTYANRFFRVEQYQRKLALMKSFEPGSSSPCDIVETWLCLYRHQPKPEHQLALQRVMRQWIASGPGGPSQMGAYEPHVGLHLPWYRDITGDTSLDAKYLAAFPQGGVCTYLLTGDEQRLEGLAATVNQDFAANWEKMAYSGCWWRTRGGFSSAAIAPALFMPALGGLCNFFGRVPWVNVLYYTDGHPGLPEDVAALYVPNTVHTQRGVKLVNTGPQTRKVRVRPVQPTSTENLLFLESPPEKALIDVTLAPGETKQVRF